jgi:hypothetical protein
LLPLPELSELLDALDDELELELELRRDLPIVHGTIPARPVTGHDA